MGGGRGGVGGEGGGEGGWLTLTKQVAPLARKPELEKLDAGMVLKTMHTLSWPSCMMTGALGFCERAMARQASASGW